jgi:hypothetical protein
MPNISIPRRWATDELYTAGSASGTPTKEDPGAALAAQGWIPGPVGAQHLNYELAAVTAMMRNAARAWLIPRKLDHVFGSSVQSIAAVHVHVPATISSEGIGTLVLAAGTDGVIKVNDGPIVTQVTDLTGTHSLVSSAAYDDGASDRIVVVHTGGALNQYTTDLGATWTAGGAMGFAAQDIIWNETLGLFLANSKSGSSVARSTNAASWASATHTLAVNGNGGIACLSSGRTVICGQDSGGSPRFTISDNGSSWSDSGGFPDPAPLSHATQGYICGNGGDVIWHVGWQTNPGANLRISVSQDGINWTTRADFTTLLHNIPPGATQPTIAPRIMCCPNTGLLVVLMCQSATSRITAIASADGGFTWTDPVYFPGSDLRMFALAGGRLFHSEAVGNVGASDGVGWR